jgi:tetratricopeptide (TPR) repeat protein
MNQAIMERRLGRYAEAKDNLLRALAIFGASLPDDHYFIALARYGSGMVSLANGDAAEATEYLQRSVPAMEKSMGAGHVDVARAKAAWSLALAMRGDLQEAARVADEVSLPASDPRARADIGYLRGRALYLAGTADACADLDQAWRSRTELDGASDGGALEAELYLGACLHSKDERSARERILHAAPLILANATSAPSVRHDATRLMRGEYRL